MYRKVGKISTVCNLTDIRRGLEYSYNINKGKLMTKKVYTSLQTNIIEAWKKTKVVHPSYGSIAKDLGCSPDSVYRTVQIYLQLKGKKE
jgi:hypothetical protein